MIRVFSEEKREELYEALDEIDLKDWKSFKEWCGSRINGFGNWMEKLDIQRYMSEVDAYQNRILNVNNSTRRQIDIVFANVAEVDRRYAQIFREYEEVIKKKLAQVQAMIDVMRAANGEDKDEQGIYTDENVSITYAVERYIKNQNKDKIECGKQILLKRLIAQGITDRAEQQKIIDMIAEQKPGMLVNLYITDCYSGMDADKVYNLIMDYYMKHKNDEKLDYAEKILDNYLQLNGYADFDEREFIIYMIREEKSQMLLNLYITNNYSSTNNDAVAKAVINYYENCVQVDDKNQYTIFYEAAILLGMELGSDGNVIINSEEEKKKYFETILMLSKGEVMGLPDVEGRFKAFMSYALFNEESNQYKLQQIAVTDERGFRRIEVEGLPESAYMVALGTYYSNSKVGDVFVVTFDNGNVIYCVTGDVKADKDTDINNQYRLDGTNIENANIIEFIIDTNNNPYLEELYIFGDIGKVSGYEDMSGAVVEIRKLNMLTLVP